MSVATPEVPTIEAAVNAVQWLSRMSYLICQRLGELTLLRDEGRNTLLGQDLGQTMTEGPEHGSAASHGFGLLVPPTPAGWQARQEAPVALQGGPCGDRVPRYDIAIMVSPNSNYRQRQSEPAEVALVLEVASTAFALWIERTAVICYALANPPTACIVRSRDRLIPNDTEPSGPADDPQYGRVANERPSELFEVSLGP